MTELERQILVAEEWGRRPVMEPVTNAARMTDYNARKALFHCVSVPVINRAAPCVTKHADRTIARLNWPARKSNSNAPMWSA